MIEYLMIFLLAFLACWLVIFLCWLGCVLWRSEREYIDFIRRW